jgi:hypothetical protein
MGLAYGFSLAELLLSPALPSTTARAGGSWGSNCVGDVGKGLRRS